MAVSSGADFWSRWVKHNVHNADNFSDSFVGRTLNYTKNAGPFGLAQSVGEELFTSALGTVGRFGSGLITGAAGFGYLHGKTTIGAAYNGGLMFGKSGLLGGVVANTMHNVGAGIGGAVNYGAVNWGKFLVNTAASGKDTITNTAKAMNKFLLTDMTENDKIGMFGKKVQKKWGWSVPFAVAGVGLGKGLLGYWDKFAASKAVNGYLDTDGVDIAPGAVNPSYSPLLPYGKGSRNRLPDDMGSNAELVLAGHAARHTGWLR